MSYFGDFEHPFQISEDSIPKYPKYLGDVEKIKDFSPPKSLSGSHGHPQWPFAKALILLGHAGEFEPPSPDKLKRNGTWPTADLLLKTAQG